MFRDRDTDGQAAVKVVSNAGRRNGAVPPARAEPSPQEKTIEFKAERKVEGRTDRPQSPVSAPSETSSAAGVPPAAAPRGGNRKRAVLAAGLLVVLAAGGAYGYRYATVGRYFVSTDDAYVRANNTTVAAKIAGYIANIAVTDNQHVHAGDVIATIDDGDYRLAVQSARDKLATQEATVARLGRQAEAQQAAIDQAQAQLASAQAAARRTQNDFERQQALVAKDFASRATFDQAQAARDQAAAMVDNGKAMVTAAQSNLDVIKAQQQEAVRTAAELRTALAKTERDLSFTVIRAPVDGVFGNRAAQPGDYVQPAQRLASVVPLNDVYIDANFKETQLARLSPGQPVTISVDALPGREIEGTVASMAPASGAVFSLLPPDNATGNFTKIVQRVPVRVAVPTDVAAELLLRPGMSVVVSVDTRTGHEPKTEAAGVGGTAVAAHILAPVY
jgi:membrane fusion protein (multidrug efflux system)